jgi:hypothetical protein
MIIFIRIREEKSIPKQKRKNTYDIVRGGKSQHTRENAHEEQMIVDVLSYFVNGRRIFIYLF